MGLRRVWQLLLAIVPPARPSRARAPAMTRPGDDPEAACQVWKRRRVIWAARDLQSSLRLADEAIELVAACRTSLDVALQQAQDADAAAEERRALEEARCFGDDDEAPLLQLADQSSPNVASNSFGADSAPATSPSIMSVSPESVVD